MVTAPLLVLLYDRMFLAGSFAEAWRRRWALYLGLAVTWGLLAYLVLSTGLVGRQSEMGAPDCWSYARTQPGVILHYLCLSIWPSRQYLGSSWPIASNVGEILPGAIAVGLLLATTVWGLVGRKAWSFLGAWFLLILAPTSSILPLLDLDYEHRMYLPLAAAAVLVAAGGYAFSGAVLPRLPVPRRIAAVVRWAAPTLVLAAVLIALGHATVVRNAAYRSVVAMCQYAVNKSPNNPMAHLNLGVVLDSSGRVSEAIDHYQEAVRLKPEFVSAQYNLGLALAGVGRFSEAIEQYQQTLRLKPDHLRARNNLGQVLALTGRTDEAIAQYREALRLKPDYAEAHNNLANALTRADRVGEAIEHYQRALRLNDDFAEAHNNLGSALARVGKSQEASEHYHHALRLRPDYPEAHYNLANALVTGGETDAAIGHYQEAVRLKPDFNESRYGLANALSSAGRMSQAIEQYDQLLERLPNFAPAMNDLARLLATRDTAQGGDPARAVELAERVRELAGQENTQCLDTLAAAYAAASRFADAITTAERAVQLAEAAGQAALAQRIQSRLELYRAGRPYREHLRSLRQSKP